MLRYRVLPLSLCRIQPMLPVKLRDYDEQLNKGRTAYDLKAVNGVAQPMAGDTFHTPNGMPLRPAGARLQRVLRGFRGDPRVYLLPKGLALPDTLVLLHEHSDQYSLQPAAPMQLAELNRLLSDLLSASPSVAKEEMLALLAKQKH